MWGHRVPLWAHAEASLLYYTRHRMVEYKIQLIQGMKRRVGEEREREREREKRLAMSTWREIRGGGRERRQREGRG